MFQIEKQIVLIIYFIVNSINTKIR